MIQATPAPRAKQYAAARATTPIRNLPQSSKTIPSRGIPTKYRSKPPATADRPTTNARSSRVIAPDCSGQASVCNWSKASVTALVAGMGRKQTLAAGRETVLAHPLLKSTVPRISGHDTHQVLRRFIELPASRVADRINGSVDCKHLSRLPKSSAEHRQMAALQSADEMLSKLLAASSDLPQAVSIVVEVREKQNLFAR